MAPAHRVETTVHVPDAYVGHRNRLKAYRAGYRAGTVADLGGTPLHAYRRHGEAAAYEHGFEVGQASKVGAAAEDAATSMVETV